MNEIEEGAAEYERLEMVVLCIIVNCLVVFDIRRFKVYEEAQ
jgi:hypothetical protein